MAWSCFLFYTGKMFSFTCGLGSGKKSCCSRGQRTMRSYNLLIDELLLNNFSDCNRNIHSLEEIWKICEGRKEEKISSMSKSPKVIPFIIVLVYFLPVFFLCTVYQVLIYLFMSSTYFPSYLSPFIVTISFPTVLLVLGI